MLFFLYGMADHIVYSPVRLAFVILSNRLAIVVTVVGIEFRNKQNYSLYLFRGVRARCVKAGVHYKHLHHQSVYMCDDR